MTRSKSTKPFLGETQTEVRVETGYLTKTGSLAVNPAQTEHLMSVEWKYARDLEKHKPGNPDIRLGLRIDEPNALYLYSTAAWEVGEEPTPEELAESGDETIVVWDARDADPPLQVPIEIASPRTGHAAYLRAMSCDMHMDYPIAREDLVFIELSEARASQVARDEIESLERTHPELFEKTCEMHGSPEAVVAVSARNAIHERWPDMVPVTKGMHDAIRERQAAWLTAKTKMAPLLEALGAALNKMQTAPDAVTAALQEAIQAEYQAVMMPILRAEWARQSDCARVLDLNTIMRQPLHQVSGEFLEHVDRSGAVLSPAEWAAMRQDPSIGTVEWTNAKVDATLQFRLEWIGARFELAAAGSSTAYTFDVGPALNVRFIDPAGERQPTGWLTYRTWPCAGDKSLDPAVAWMRDNLVGEAAFDEVLRSSGESGRYSIRGKTDEATHVRGRVVANDCVRMIAKLAELSRGGDMFGIRRPSSTGRD